MNLSNFDSLPQDRKIALLKEALTLEDISSAKLISRKMECSITTEKGFKKVLPLLNRTESSFYRNKIVSWGIFKEKSIISEFGEVNGLEALGRATLGNLTVHNAFFDLGLPRLIPKNKTFTSLDNLRTALFSKAGDVFDLIYSNGVDHLRSERRHFERHNPKSQEYWGFLNEIAKAVYPASKTRSFHTFVDDFALACQEHPEKMRGMAKALLFDLDENGNEIPNPKFQQTFWEGSARYSREWITRIPELLEKNILTHEEGEILFKQVLEAKADFVLYVTESSEDLELHLPCVHLLLDWFAALKRKGFRDVEALFIATKNPSHILGMVEETINICSYPSNKFTKEKVVLNEILSGIEAEYLKKMAANDHQPPARKPLKI